MSKKDPKDPCKDNRPKVIEHVIIQECLEEQGLKGEAGRLAREEGVPWDEVKEIRLEYMNLLRIDYLWVLPALRTLSLSNNLLEKIENLESLVNLTHLDLSFNKISKIENLDALVNIETLLLFENLIRTMENLNSLSKLSILSIGSNKIADEHNVLYLRRFKNLKSVNMNGNPCTKDETFRTFLSTFLPQLVYYEYKKIEDSERALGQIVYQKDLFDLEETERIAREAELKKEAQIAEAELQSESFVEFLNTNQLFDLIFDNDTEGKLFITTGSEAQQYYDDYKTQTLETCLQIFTIGQEQYHIRKTEVVSFKQKVEGAKKKIQDESIAQMEDFTKIKLVIYETLRALQEDVVNRDLSLEGYNYAVNEYKQIIQKHIHGVWKKLMGLEILLFEQVVEVNEIFEVAETEMVTNFIETAQGGFAQIRILESMFMENISEYANRYLQLAALGEIFDVPPPLLQYMTDKDGLINSLATSHDIHMQIIDNREDRLVSRAKEWLKNLVTDLQKDEITRDRAKILEINTFLDLQRAEFDRVSRFDIVEGDEKD